VSALSRASSRLRGQLNEVIHIPDSGGAGGQESKALGLGFEPEMVDLPLALHELRLVHL
jgi:hypothetical protein